MDALLSISGLAAESLNTVSALLSNLGDFFWDDPMFQKDGWEHRMNVLRLVLTFGGAMLFLYAWRARRMGTPVLQRTERGIAYLFTVLAFFVYFDFFNPHTRYKEYYHRHEFYHYYLGSKYFKEVGYLRLYECTMIAEAEMTSKNAIKNREIRDLRVNLIKPVTDTAVFKNPDDCKKRFSPERWKTFKTDIDWFRKAAAGTYWENMQKDHGYNPPPVWTMAGKFFGSFGPASDGYFKILACMDVLFHLGTILLLRWAFGWRVMAVATVFWGCNAPANFYWTGGAFMRQDWLFFLVASVCLARKRMFFLAGGALTWSALLRIFPAALFAGWGVIMGLQVLKRLRYDMAQKKLANSGDTKQRKKRRRAAPKWLLPAQKRVLLGCIATAGVLVPLSIAVTGPDSYPAFFRHISVHRHTPLTNHMGLEAMLTHRWETRMRFARDDNLDDPFQGWKEGKLEAGKRMRPLQMLIATVVGLWVVWALRRTKLLWVGVPMGLPLIPALTNLTCYYYSMFIIMAILTRARPQLAAVMLVSSGASQILYIRNSYFSPGFYWIDDKFTAIAVIFFLLGILMLAVYSRPFSMQRLKAWWDGKPEPKAPSLPASAGLAKPAETT